MGGAFLGEPPSAEAGSVEGPGQAGVGERALLPPLEAWQGAAVQPHKSPVGE